MNTQTTHSLKDMLCREVEVIADKGEMSAGDLEALHKLTDTIKNLNKIEMLEQVDDSYSRNNSYRNSYRNSYGDNSYGYDGRNRDSMGRYSGRDYSGDDYSGKRYVRGYYRDGIKDKLQELMEEAGTEKERKAIQKAMESME